MELMGEPWYTEPNQQPWRERPSQKQPTQLFRARISSLSRSPLSCAPLGDRTGTPINTRDSVGAVRRKDCIQSTTPSLKSRSSLSLSRHAEIPVEPCIPSGGKKVPDRANWLHEIKHDRYRHPARRQVRAVI